MLPCPNRPFPKNRPSPAPRLECDEHLRDIQLQRQRHERLNRRHDDVEVAERLANESADNS